MRWYSPDVRERLLEQVSQLRAGPADRDAGGLAGARGVPVPRLRHVIRAPRPIANPRPSLKYSTRFVSSRPGGIRRSMWPFLKEFVKQKRFSSGWLCNGSAGAYVVFSSGLSGSRDCYALTIVSLRAPARSSLLRFGKLQSFFSTRLLPTHSFARYHSR